MKYLAAYILDTEGVWGYTPPYKEELGFMTSFGPPWETKPDFINPEGVKWWFDKSSTEYAHQDTETAKGLPNIVVYYAERPDGYRTRIIVDNDIKAAVGEAQSLEALGAKIDMMKVNRSFGG